MAKRPTDLILPTPEEDAAIQRGIDADPDSPELDDAWFARARPAAEIMPPQVLRDFGRQRGKQKAPLKTKVSMRLDADLVERLRAGGAGWQRRVNEMLRAGLAGR